MVKHISRDILKLLVVLHSYKNKKFKGGFYDKKYNI